MLKWGDDKRFKLANQRLSRLNHSDMKNTFTPELDDRSRKLAGKRKGEVHDRLIQCGKDTNKKKKDLLKAENKNLFNPKISEKSRKLANGLREDDLIKLDNGQTVNLDFWEAIPTGAGSLTLKSKPRQCTNDDQKMMIYRCGAEDEFIKNYDKSPKGKKDPHPDYTSPYTKELLASGIPLKTIINRSKKINNKRAKQYQSGKGGKSKSRGKSGKRNKSLSKSTDFTSNSLKKGGRGNSTRRRRSKSPGRSRSGRGDSSNTGKSRDERAKEHLKSMKQLGKQSRKGNRTGRSKSTGRPGGATSRSKSGKGRRDYLIEQTIPHIYDKNQLTLDQRKPSKSPCRHHCDASFPDVIALNPKIIMPLRMKSSNMISKKYRNLGKESARDRRIRLYDDEGVRTDLKKYESEKGKKKMKELIYRDLRSPSNTKGNKVKEFTPHTTSGKKTDKGNQNTYDVGNFYMYQSFNNLDDEANRSKKKGRKSGGVSQRMTQITIGDRR